MILTVFVTLNALGFAAWILGSVFEWTEVAVLGGVVIVGAGAMVLNDGLEHRSGQVRENETADRTVVTHEYSEVPMHQKFSLGIIVMILGSAAVLRALESAGD